MSTTQKVNTSQNSASTDKTVSSLKPDHFFGAAENIKVEPNYSEAEVEIHAKYIVDYADTFAAYAVQAFPHMKETYDEVRERCRDYFLHLVKFRVDYVNLKKIPFPITDRTYVVPAFLSCVLEQVGRVESAEYALSLKPVLGDEFNALDTWDSSRVAVEARWFRTLCDQIGVVYAKGMLKSRDGEISLMTMMRVQDEIKNERSEAHPVYALMAAFLDLNITTNVTCAHFSYGRVSDIRRALMRVIDYEVRT